MRSPFHLDVLVLSALLCSTPSLHGEPRFEPTHPSSTHDRNADHSLVPLRDAIEKSDDRCQRLLDQCLRFDRDIVDFKRATSRVALLRQLAEELPGQHGLVDDTPEQLFRLLQREFLQGPFDAYCPSVGETLCTGRYNCLTASILYVAVCRQQGITAQVAASFGHVRVELIVDGTPVWIEMTDPVWHPSRMRLTGEHQIDDTQTLARLAYNRGTRLARQGEYAAAIRWLRKSVRLDPDYQESKDNLAATFNNWAISQIEAGNFSRARNLVADGLRYQHQAEELLRTQAYLNRTSG